MQRCLHLWFRSTVFDGGMDICKLLTVLVASSTSCGFTCSDKVLKAFLMKKVYVNDAPLVSASTKLSAFRFACVKIA